jgi:hypothetical protein
MNIVVDQTEQEGEEGFGRQLLNNLFDSSSPESFDTLSAAVIPRHFGPGPTSSRTLSIKDVDNSSIDITQSQAIFFSQLNNNTEIKMKSIVSFDSSPIVSSFDSTLC